MLGSLQKLLNLTYRDNAKKNPRNCVNMWNFYGFSQTNLNSTRLIYYDGTANSA